MKPVLYIVIPCYNEEAVLPITAPLFENKLKELAFGGLIDGEKSRILFVDDGSKDKTWGIITGLSAENRCFKGLRLTRNKGHQNALLAGLSEAADQCDITISVDCDGQDDLDAMGKMVNEYLAGNDVVYGVRESRNTDSFFKRTTAHGFYRLLNFMGAEVIYDHADYRLLSSRALKALFEFKEVNIYLRGMVPMVGFSSTCVYYERQKRLAGKSKYPLKKMISLAFDGLTSLSVKPIRFITSFGFLVAVISLIGIIWSVITRFTGNSVTGWASVVSIVCFLGGIQLLSLGVIGEYIGKIYLETKARPRFQIRERTEEKKDE